MIPSENRHGSPTGGLITAAEMLLPGVAPDPNCEGGVRCDDINPYVVNSPDYPNLEVQKPSGVILPENWGEDVSVRLCSGIVWGAYLGVHTAVASVHQAHQNGMEGGREGGRKREGEG